MKNFFLTLSFAVALSVISCGKQESEVKPEDNSSKTEISTENTPQEPKQDSQPNPEPKPQPTPPAQNTDKPFVYKILLEEITGNWCKNCPRVTRAFDKVKENQKFSNRIVTVAIHEKSRYGQNDPMAIRRINDILAQDYMQKLPSNPWDGRFPYATRNRWYSFSNGDGYVTGIFEELEKNPTSNIGIKIESSLKENGGNVKVSFKFREKYESLKYSVFITESNYKASQVMDYGSLNHNFIHNDILIDAFGDVTGNDLGSPEKDTEISKDCNVSFNLWTKDLKNVKVVVFVADSKGEVINAQSVLANEKVDYQYAE